MIFGIGTDIIEIERVKKALSSPGFTKKIYTENEADNSNAATLAGFFAAKEAVSKAMGTGFLGFLPKDIEIKKDKYGKPFASLHGKAKENAENSGIKAIHISISHSREYAAAFALAEKEDKK